MSSWNNIKASLLVVTCVVHLTVARIGFKKDQSTTRIDFPPRLARRSRDSGIPHGHLRPLGWQRRPEGRVQELDVMPAPEEFFRDYVTDHKPVVFRGVMNDVPVMELWAKDEYLKTNYDELNIHVVVKKELFQKGPRKMRFRQFLREYQYSDWYLTNSVPQPMMKELTLPHCLKCGLRSFLVESELWMSSGGTGSLLHAHADHNLHCLLAGRKDFILIHPNHTINLAWVERNSHPGAGYSTMDVDMINMFQYKEVAKVPWRWSTLKPGDCIYTPATYLHQVRSYGRSISWTILWAPAPEPDFSDCQDTDLDKPMALEKASLMWTYVDADRQLTNTRLNANSLRHHLMLLLRVEDALKKEVFVDFFNEVMSEIDDHPGVNDVWKILDPENLGHVTREKMKVIADDLLTQVADILNLSRAQKHDEL